MFDNLECMGVARFPQHLWSIRWLRFIQMWQQGVVMGLQGGQIVAEQSVHCVQVEHQLCKMDLNIFNLSILVVRFCNPLDNS